MTQQLDTMLLFLPEELLVDVGQLIQSVLGDKYQILGNVGLTEELIGFIRKEQPSVLVLDRSTDQNVRVISKHNLELMREACPEMRFVLFLGFKDEAGIEMAREALELGIYNIVFDSDKGPSSTDVIMAINGELNADDVERMLVKADKKAKKKHFGLPMFSVRNRGQSAPSRRPSNQDIDLIEEEIIYQDEHDEDLSNGDPEDDQDGSEHDGNALPDGEPLDLPEEPKTQKKPSFNLNAIKDLLPTVKHDDNATNELVLTPEVSEESTRKKRNKLVFTKEEKAIVDHSTASSGIIKTLILGKTVQYKEITKSHTLVVWSPKAGAGATTTVTALHTQASLSGIHPVAIDFHMDSPTLHLMFGDSEFKGIDSIPQNEPVQKVKTYFKETNDGLALFGSREMGFADLDERTAQTVLDAAKELSRVVFVDVDPDPQHPITYLAMTEATAILAVVNPDVLSLHMLMRGLQALRELDIDISKVFLVFNEHDGYGLSPDDFTKLVFEDAKESDPVLGVVERDVGRHAKALKEGRPKFLIDKHGSWKAILDKILV